jgi:CBS domain-containing protein
MDGRGLGTGSGFGMLPFGFATWDYQAGGRRVLEAAMTIAAVLRNKGSTVETIAAGASLSDAVATLGEKRIGALPVIQDGRIAGIISERDVIYSLRDHGAEVLEWPVERVMSTPAITTDPDSGVLSALAMMTKRRIRHLPVVEGGAIRGIVSIGDLVKYRMELIENEAEAMRTYIQSA